jgi:hypothetical protein
VVTHADQVAALKAAEDNLAILEQVAGGAAGTAKTKFSEEDLNTLKAAFKSYAKAPGPETYARYEDSVRNNYVVDSVMAEHLAFYLSYADEIIRDVQARPELVAKPVRTQFNYLAEDLMDIGSARSGSRVENPKASVKGKEVAAALAAAATAGNGVKKPLRR